MQVLVGDVQRCRADASAYLGNTRALVRISRVIARLDVGHIAVAAADYWGLYGYVLALGIM